MKHSTFRERINTNELAREYAQFVESLCTWDYFVTVTYRNPQRCLEKVQRDAENFPWQWSLLDALEAGHARRRIVGASHPAAGSSPEGHASPPLQQVRWSGPYVKCRDKSYRTRPMFVMAIEPHKSGALHAHGLIRSPDWFPLSIKAGNKAWHDRHRAWVSIEVPQSQRHVSAYCGKYVLKGGEIVLGANLQKVPASNDAAILGPLRAG